MHIKLQNKTIRNRDQRYKSARRRSIRPGPRPQEVSFKTLGLLHTVKHRRRIKTEEKARVAAVCGTESIQFLAALDILIIFHQDDFEEKDD